MHIVCLVSYESSAIFTVSTNNSGCAAGVVGVVAALVASGDGDLYLATSHGSSRTLCIYEQMAQGGFATVPTVVGDRAMLNAPSFISLADMDQDDVLDLVTLDLAGTKVFFQRSPGDYGPDPLVITDAIRSVKTADIDRDGATDLVSVYSGEEDDSYLSIFFGGR